LPSKSSPTSQCRKQDYTKQKQRRREHDFALHQVQDLHLRAPGVDDLLLQIVDHSRMMLGIPVLAIPQDHF